MTNLVPGSLFHTPGLNRNFTPTPNTVTPKDLDKIYAREPFNGHSWPPDSPVTRVYDVSNTSTRMIVLNNKYRKTSRLRGYDETELTRVPDPGRHSRASSAKNPRAHRNCYDSSSPYFEPEIETNLEWLSSNNQRQHLQNLAKSAVNPKRHTSCKVPTDPPEFRAGVTSPIPRRRRFFPSKNSMIFNYPEMPPGEKLYLWSMERIYSAKNLMALKKDQYMQLLQRNSRGVHSYQEYLKYMRYINRPKTAPLPSKTGWSRPMSPTKSVNSDESTKDNGPKQETIDKKSRPSSEVSQKSQSDQFESSKPESKKQNKPEQEKPESSKVGVSTAQAVTGIRSPSRSRPSSLRSRKGSAGSQTSLGSQENTQRKEDANVKDKPKDAVKSKAEEEEGEGSDKHSISGDENDERRKKYKEGVNRPLSRRGHVSPTALVQEKLQEKDQNSTDQEKEEDQNQKSTDLKQGEAADEKDKKSEEHDSRPSTVLSIQEQHVERPESGKSTSSKGKGAQTQMSIDEVEENKTKLSNRAESLVSINSNNNQQISRARRDSVDQDTDGRANQDVHRARRDSGGEDSPREGNKEIHRARRDSEETEDDKDEARRGSGEIHGARRDSLDADDDRRGNRDVDNIAF